MGDRSISARSASSASGEAIARSRPRWHALLGALSVVPLVALQASAATLTVGSGVGCQYATLEAAIAAAASGDSLRLEGKTFSNTAGSCTNFNIYGKSLTLIGGYAAACNGTLAATRTVLAGTPGCADSVLEIGGSSSERFIQLIAVDITGGTLDGDGGGGIDIIANSQVTLDGVRVYGNTSGSGGGIDIDGTSGATLTLRSDTRVNDNVAELDGGGISCRGGATITLETVQLLGNESYFDGGGIFADGCTLATTPNPHLAIGLNRASSFGGGIYLLGSQGTLDAGTSVPGVVLSTNEAGAGGGGVYLYASQLTLRSADLVDNRADHGGAALVVSGTLTIERSGSTGRPPNLYGNAAADGAVASVGDDVAALALSSALIWDNVAEEDHLVAVRGNGVVSAANTVFRSNGPNFLGGLFDLEATGTLLLTNVTTNGNSVGWVVSAESTSTVGVSATVFDEPGTPIFQSYPADRDLECLAVPAGATLPPGVNGSYFGPSGLAADGIHLLASSPLIDRCAPASCSSLDYDREARPHGPACDVGADEVVPIFVDGFESGNTNAWG